MTAAAPMSSRLEAYYATRAAQGGTPIPTLYHISLTIAGRVVSSKVRGINAAYARLDLMIEQEEAVEQDAKGRIVLAENCKIRAVTELDPVTRGYAHEFAVRARLARWGV